MCVVCVCDTEIEIEIYKYPLAIDIRKQGIPNEPSALMSCLMDSPCLQEMCVCVCGCGCGWEDM